MKAETIEQIMITKVLICIKN